MNKDAEANRADLLYLLKESQDLQLDGQRDLRRAAILNALYDFVHLAPPLAAAGGVGGAAFGGLLALSRRVEAGDTKARQVMRGIIKGGLVGTATGGVAAAGISAALASPKQPIFGPGGIMSKRRT